MSIIRWVLQSRTNSNLSVMRLCAFFLLTVVSCCGGAEQAPPHGFVVSSVLVNPEQYTADGGQYDLFIQAVPGNKTARLTNHQATPKLKLGGAIRNPLFSHDGKNIVFLADYSDSDERRTTVTGAAQYPNTFLNIWKVQIDTRNISPITKGDFGWSIFGWSPDDRFLCATYPSKMGTLDQDALIPDEVYAWNMRTLQGRKLARIPDGVDDAFWSRTGSSIDYQTGPNANLYSVPRQGGKSKLLLRGKTGRSGYSFSPDGRKVAYVDINKVYIANADGSKPKLVIKLLRGEDAPYWPKPQWSKDGKKLAIYELSQNAQAPTKLHVYDEITAKDRVVATLHEFVTTIAWSRDGQWLIAKTLSAGSTEKPDPKTGWYTFHREGLVAVGVADRHIVTLKEPNEETKGLDWFEIAK